MTKYNNPDTPISTNRMNSVISPSKGSPRLLRPATNRWWNRMSSLLGGKDSTLHHVEDGGEEERWGDLDWLGPLHLLGAEVLGCQDPTEPPDVLHEVLGDGPPGPRPRPGAPGWRPGRGWWRSRPRSRPRQSAGCYIHIFFSQRTILHIYQNKISSFLQIYWLNSKTVLRQCWTNKCQGKAMSVNKVMRKTRPLYLSLWVTLARATEKACMAVRGYWKSKV